MVLDRILLWIFSVACIAGTCGIILVAPSLYDTRTPLDILVSKISKRELLPAPVELIQRSYLKWFTVSKWLIPKDCSVLWNDINVDLFSFSIFLFHFSLSRLKVGMIYIQIVLFFNHFDLFPVSFVYKAKASGGLRMWSVSSVSGIWNFRWPMTGSMLLWC